MNGFPAPRADRNGDDFGGHWPWILAGRVAIHVIVGATVTAIVGALCVGAAGAATVCLLIGECILPNLGGIIGLVFGSFGGVAGALIFGIAGATAPPSRFLLPRRALLARVCGGQIGGTLLACSAYATLNIIQRHFGLNPTGDVDGVMFGAPALMICGAIAGALFRPGQRA